MAEKSLGNLSSALAEEDPRLSPAQAARIARQLTGVTDVTDVTDRASAPPQVRHVRPTSSEHEASTTLRRLLEQVVRAVPSATGARLQLGVPGGDVSEEYGRMSSGEAVDIPFRIESRLDGILTLHGTGGVSPDERRVLEAVGCLAGTTIAATRMARESLEGSPLASLVAALFDTGPKDDASGLSADDLRRVVERDALHTVFQPVYDLYRRRVVGYEALTRFPPEPPLAVQEWFAAAADAGFGTTLEVAAVRRALEHLPRVAKGRFLAVNVSPRTAVSPELAGALVGSEPRRIVLEITEHAPVDDYGALSASLADLRAAGVRLAIDDAGAGFASLRHVLRLAPDLIKLDLSLVRRIDADPLRRALATSLITFATEAGATIVAEGIETRFELDTLVALGVRFGQGHHLGRPGPLRGPRE